MNTIEREDYSWVSSRVWDHPGAVVDLGCLSWNWSSIFLKRKRVIGADPFAEPIDGAELFQGVVGPVQSQVTMSMDKHGASSLIRPNGETVTVPAVTWQEFRKRYALNEIAILKMNIEGSEYPLLESITDEELRSIDQIVVAFHHFIWQDMWGLTIHALDRLFRLGFNIQRTHEKWAWYLCMRTKWRDHQRIMLPIK